MSIYYILDTNKIRFVFRTIQLFLSAVPLSLSKIQVNYNY